MIGKSVTCPIMQVFGKFKTNLKYDFLVRYFFIQNILLAVRKREPDSNTLNLLLIEKEIAR